MKGGISLTQLIKSPNKNVGITDQNKSKNAPDIEPKTVAFLRV